MNWLLFEYANCFGGLSYRRATAGFTNSVDYLDVPLDNSPRPFFSITLDHSRFGIPCSVARQFGLWRTNCDGQLTTDDRSPRTRIAPLSQMYKVAGKRQDTARCDHDLSGYF